MADFIDRAKESSQCDDEIFGRQVGRIMEEVGLTIADLARRTHLPIDYLSQLVQGQSLIPIRTEWARAIVGDGLGLVEARGAQWLSREDCNLLVQLKTPRESKMDL